MEDGDVLKVDSFLNHQMDVELFQAMGKEWARLFAGEGVSKILTIEASGIGIACVAALEFGVPVVFAKKSRSRNLSGDVYHTEVPSFTHGGVSDVVVSRRFLSPDDRLLLIDDFLANGAALEGPAGPGCPGRGRGGGRGHRRREGVPARRRTHPGKGAARGVAGAGQTHGAGAHRVLLSTQAVSRETGNPSVRWKTPPALWYACPYHRGGRRFVCPSSRKR